MSEIVLDAELRGTVGKHAKYSRSKGMVPGVFYSRGEQNISLEVAAVALAPLIYTSETHIIDLRLNNGPAKKCILRDVQFDPVSDRPIHFDLQGLKENEKLTIEVPIVLTGGIPKGVKDGGMIQHMIHKLRVSCLPKDIPAKVEIDISQLEINHSVHVREIQLQNATILDNLDSPIVGVVPPTVVKEAEVAPVVEAAAAEPEVIGKGKKPEEGQEGTEAAPKAEAKPAAKEEKKEKEKK